MSISPYECEHRCACSLSPHGKTEFVVLTGGPGAGKTAVLEFMRKMLCEHVAILPESASILFGGGFWRLSSESAKKAAQRAIFQVQKEMQNLVVGEKKWGLGLCDRGSLDGLAYWPGNENEFFQALGTSKEQELAKYKAVIHLKSPGRTNGYNYQNPIRIETPEVAAIIDQRIQSVWKDHPNYTCIESTVDFVEKVDRASTQIQGLIPECCRRK